jgi:hypothetical protein
VVNGYRHIKEATLQVAQQSQVLSTPNTEAPNCYVFMMSRLLDDRYTDRQQNLSQRFLGQLLQTLYYL